MLDINIVPTLRRAIHYALFSRQDYLATAAQIKEHIADGKSFLTEENVRLSENKAAECETDARLLEGHADAMELTWEDEGETVNVIWLLQVGAAACEDSGRESCAPMFIDLIRALRGKKE